MQYIIKFIYLTLGHTKQLNISKDYLNIFPFIFKKFNECYLIVIIYSGDGMVWIKIVYLFTLYRVIQNLAPPSRAKMGRPYVKPMIGHQNIFNLNLICQRWWLESNFWPLNEALRKTFIYRYFSRLRRRKSVKKQVICWFEAVRAAKGKATDYWQQGRIQKKISQLPRIKF